MYRFKYSYRAKDAWILPLLLVCVSLIYSFLFSVIVTKIAISSGATTEAEINAFASLPWVTVINMFMGQLFIFGTYIIYSLYAEKKIVTASTIKGKFRLFPILVVVLLSTVCLFGFNYLIAIIDTGLTKLTGSGVSSVEVLGGFGGYVVTALLFAVVPAIVEEFVYRGVIYNGLQKSYSPIVAIILSSLVFSLMHFNIYQTIYQFIMGVILGTICYYTGSILYSIIFHLVNNLLVVTLAYVAPNLFVVNNLSALVIVLIILGAICASAIIFGLFVLLKRLCKKYDTKAEVVEEKDEESQLLEKTQGLSQYDIKQLNIKSPEKDKKNVGLMIVILAVLWVITNFL